MGGVKNGVPDNTSYPNLSVAKTANNLFILRIPYSGFEVKIQPLTTGKLTYQAVHVNVATGTFLEEKAFRDVSVNPYMTLASTTKMNTADVQLFILENGIPSKEVNPDGTVTNASRQILMRLNSSEAFLSASNFYTPIAVDPTNDTVSPFTLHGKTMGPVRFIENLGAIVKYNGVDQPVTITYGNTELTLTFDNPVMKKSVNGSASTNVTLPTAPTMVEGNTNMRLISR